jgi:hypothetical protein
MDGWDIFIIALAALATSIVVMKAFFDLRQNKIERVRDALMDLVHQGESILEADRLHAQDCEQWSAQAAAVVRQRLARPLADGFAEATRDLAVGVEAAEMRESSSGGRRLTSSRADAVVGEGMREGVRWLRQRARLLRPGDLRGRFW